jgi:hypothetical protein
MLRFVFAALAFVAAASLAVQLATRDGVGVFEYVVGVALTAALLVVSFTLARPTTQQAATR